MQQMDTSVTIGFRRLFSSPFCLWPGSGIRLEQSDIQQSAKEDGMTLATSHCLSANQKALQVPEMLIGWLPSQKLYGQRGAALPADGWGRDGTESGDGATCQVR
jgi:hypothetical protein